MHFHLQVWEMRMKHRIRDSTLLLPDVSIRGKQHGFGGMLDLTIR